MAPLKQVKTSNTMGLLPRPIQSKVKQPTVTTRSKASLNQQLRPKRKAEFSPTKENVKRSAMGDITNAKKNLSREPLRKAVVQLKTLPSLKTVTKLKQNENVPPPAPHLNGVMTRAVGKVVVANQTALKPKEPLKEIGNTRIKTRLSNEFEKTQESLYSSALEELNETVSSTGSKTCKGKVSPVDENMSPESDTVNASEVTLVAHELESKLNIGDHNVPEGVDDFDKEIWDDVYQVSHYAMDIFTYLKAEEPKYDIPDYMGTQVCLTNWMRSLLVDWMVEVQESFELNHETLYLGVKLVDLYLSRVLVSKETLQLVGAASIFIASKYDERIPPAIDDFLYICDGAYKRRELLRMEIIILKVCDFKLGMPLSYRFLRRYARCAKISMPVLTLARYILEYSLMDYSTITVRDSKLAASALYLAIKMRKVSGWTPALEFYSGYKLVEITSTATMLNTIISRKPKTALMTVRNKYSHKIFFEVAQTPLIENEDL